MNNDSAERVCRAIYDTFARQGHAQIRDLAAGRHVALDESGAVVMAHPFAAVPLGFSVMGERTLWWGGCAWDSFAIPHLVTDEPSVLVATTCPGCRRPLAWTVTSSGPPAGAEVAHFLVPMPRVWDDVVYTCANQHRPRRGLRHGSDHANVRTRKVPPATSVPSACTDRSGGSTTDGRWPRH